MEFLSSSNNETNLSRFPQLPLRSQARILTAVMVLAGSSIPALLLLSTSPTRDNNASSPSYMRSISPSLDRFLQEQTAEAEADSLLQACDLDCCMNFESEICPNDNDWINVLPFSVQIILIIVLLGLSALFSGLTLGLMSLDKTGLEIVMGGDNGKNREYAKKIYPIRENGNLLLCTLLLGNVAVNALLSILLSVYAGGAIGFVTSTFLIVIFGEIVPQALVSIVLYAGGV
jgi:hypothetical protein